MWYAVIMCIEDELVGIRRALENIAEELRKSNEPLPPIEVDEVLMTKDGTMYQPREHKCACEVVLGP